MKFNLIQTLVNAQQNSLKGLDQGCRGRDCMVVGSTTTYAISVYHH